MEEFLLLFTMSVVVRIALVGETLPVTLDWKMAFGSVLVGKWHLTEQVVMTEVEQLWVCY